MGKRIYISFIRPLYTCLLLALGTDLIIEMLNHHGAVAGIMHAAEGPAVFLANALIIASTLALGFPYKRKVFFVVSIILFWLGVAIANGILMTFRTTPLRAVDLRVFSSIMSILKVYMTSFQIFLIFVAIAALLTAFVIMWIRFPKLPARRLSGLLLIFVVIGMTAGTLYLDISKGTIPKNFVNLRAAYQQYGFVYCFSESLIDNGVKRPQNYTKMQIDEILARLPESSESNQIAMENCPNIVFVQLESFFDVTRMAGLEFSEDPIPNFRKLYDSYPSGLLTVSCIGAGTSNTEMEIMTGMSMKYFGAGEYPYSTIFRKEAPQTMCTIAHDCGMSTHAVHDHTGRFYARNKVYKKFGFDTFTSREYMQDVEYNVLGWAKDSIMTGEIMKALECTENRDFVLGVTVQTHGKYPTEPIDSGHAITVSGSKPESLLVGYEYFINQIYEMDLFIGDLIQTMEAYEEPTVVVLYGDHLPNFGLENGDIAEGSLYQTEYVIWSNYDVMAGKEDMNLHTYQLAARTLELLGIDGDIITKLHQTYDFNNANVQYGKDLHALQYDMLYGEKHAYRGDPPIATDMKMGIDEITVTGIYEKNGDLYVRGEFFTPASAVILEGDRKETEFISASCIVARGCSIREGEAVQVGQVGSPTVFLSKTGEYTYVPGGAPIPTPQEAETISGAAITSEGAVAEEVLSATESALQKGGAVRGFDTTESAFRLFHSVSGRAE